MNSKTWLQSIWYWRVAVFECLSDAFIAGAMVWCAAVANEDWGAISGTARHVIEVSVAIAVLKVIRSFLSTTAQVLKDQMPIPDAGQIVTRKQTDRIKVEPAQPDPAKIIAAGGMPGGQPQTQQTT